MFTLKKFKFISTFSLFLLHALNGFSQLPQVKSYYPSAGLQAKVLEYGFGEELFAPSLYYKATFLNNRGTYFSFGASAYPTITVSPSNYKGTVIFGAELPLTIELYTNNIERDYFFFGFGVTSGYYAIREFDNLGGFGPHFVMGGSLPLLRGEIGYKGSFTYYRNSLQGTLGFYYQIGYGY